MIIKIKKKSKDLPNILIDNDKTIKTAVKTYIISIYLSLLRI